MKFVRAVLPDDSLNRCLLMLFLLLWAASCIRLPNPQYFAMQHVPTIAAVVALAVADKRWRIDRFSYAFIVLFLVLHVVGARYLYSYVPYDDWTEKLFGIRISNTFGFTRNHYDRLVHFCFGLLLIQPLWAIFADHLRLNHWWTAALSISMVLAASAVYEIVEWGVAITFAPDWADAYNGQQGDPWDAQRDMALAGVGALMAVGAMWFRVASREVVKAHR